VTPPESVPADPVDLMRWRPDWASALLVAVKASLPQLAPYMPWATPAYGLDEARTYIDSSIADWDAGLNWNYAIVTGAGEVVGSTGLMTRMGPGVLEIGYWLHSGHTGLGYATAAAQALADVGLAQHGIERVLIRHDAANTASGRVAEKAGFVRIAEIASSIDVPDGSGTEVRWERRVRANR
jgi:ribosomal-protein-serine acetyltransferase